VVLVRAAFGANARFRIAQVRELGVTVDRLEAALQHDRTARGCVKLSQRFSESGLLR
jgi:hypothetical protein